MDAVVIMHILEYYNNTISGHFLVTIACSHCCNNIFTLECTYVCWYIIFHIMFEYNIFFAI